MPVAALNQQSRPSEQRVTLAPSTEAIILEAVRSLHYGSVEVTVHDSRVVQIECRKKIRLEPKDPKES
jgi:hypothetical protein